MKQDIFLQNLEKSAGIWSTVTKPITKAWGKVPQQVKNVGTAGFGLLGAAGAVDHFKEGQNIKPVYKQAAFNDRLEKSAFLGAVSKAINTVGGSKIVNKLNSVPVFLGSMAAEGLSGQYKAKKDQDFQIHNEIQKQQQQFNKRNAFNNQLQKRAGLDTFLLKKYVKGKYQEAKDSITQSTNENLKYLRKYHPFVNGNGENEGTEKQASFLSVLKGVGSKVLNNKITSNLGRSTLKGAQTVTKSVPATSSTIAKSTKATSKAVQKSLPTTKPIELTSSTGGDVVNAVKQVGQPSAFEKRLKGYWDTLGSKNVTKTLGNAAGIAFAADTAISLNNTRKNIQTAAPSVPQRPINTNMYNGGSHPSSYQNTYGM